MVPTDSPVDSQHLLHITASPSPQSLKIQPITLQMYLLVTPEGEVEERQTTPICNVVADTWLRACLQRESTSCEVSS